MIYANSLVPFDEIRKKNGKTLEHLKQKIQKADPDSSGKFHLALDDHMSELEEILSQQTSAERVQGFDPAVHTFRLVSRRLKTHLNSLGGELSKLNEKTPTNYAYMNPEDMVELEVDDDEIIEITSPKASLLGVVKSSEDIRRGVISMAHSWGSATSSDEKVRDIGSPTNRLIDVENGFDPITGQAVQSAIPVSVKQAQETIPI